MTPGRWRQGLTALAVISIVAVGTTTMSASAEQPDQRPPSPPGQSGDAPGRSGTTPAATSPAATSPAATSPAATSPAATSPAATSPAATSPAATSPAATSPAATSPGRGNGSTSADGRSGNGNGDGNGDDESEDDGPTARYVVRFVGGASPAAEAPGLQRDGAKVERLLERVFSGAVVELGEKGLERLRRNPRVAAVEPDMVVTTFTTQTNPPWGLDRVDQRSLPLSGFFTSVAQGSGVRVYVVDTGVRADHVDFGGRVVAGTTLIADGQGTSDCNGHGTHVAGTVAGTTYGVAKRATIVPVRVLGCDGSGTLSGVVAGLDWILAQHPAGTPGVVNMSLGGGASSTLDAAVSRVVASGLVAAVAAGNSGVDACGTSPARVAAALTVGATSSNDTRASWSNYGSCIDLFAPGVNITSAWPTSSTATSAISGTSMAAPHVAGLVAVLWSQQPGSSASQIQIQVVADATPGVVVSAGSGSPNRLAFVEGGGDGTTTTTSTTTTTTTTTTPISTTTTTRAPRGNAGGNGGGVGRPPRTREDGSTPVSPIEVPPGLSNAAQRIATSGAPAEVQQNVLQRLVEVGGRFGDSTSSASAVVAVAALVVETIERAPLPEPIRQRLVERIQQISGDTPGDAAQPIAEVPTEALREVVDDFRNQRLLMATNQLNGMIERLESRLDQIGDQTRMGDLRAALAALRDRVATIVEAADVREIVSELRELLRAMVELIQDGGS